MLYGDHVSLLPLDNGGFPVRSLKSIRGSLDGAVSTLVTVSPTFPGPSHYQTRSSYYTLQANRLVQSPPCHLYYLFSSTC